MHILRYLDDSIYLILDGVGIVMGVFIYLFFYA